MSIEYFNVADLVDPDDSEGRTYRQINKAKIHKFKVGQLVELDDGVRMYVAKQSRDCDGTPLYCLTHRKGDYEQLREGFANFNWANGISEEEMKLVEMKDG